LFAIVPKLPNDRAVRKAKSATRKVGTRKAGAKFVLRLNQMVQQENIRGATLQIECAKRPTATDSDVCGHANTAGTSRVVERNSYPNSVLKRRGRGFVSKIMTVRHKTDAQKPQPPAEREHYRKSILTSQGTVF
jgi:hypothetical protein